MSDQQLYMMIGIPCLFTVAGILINVWWFRMLLRQIDSVEARLDARFDRLDVRFDQLDQKFKI